MHHLEELGLGDAPAVPRGARPLVELLAVPLVARRQEDDAAHDERDLGVVELLEARVARGCVADVLLEVTPGRPLQHYDQATVLDEAIVIANDVRVLEALYETDLFQAAQAAPPSQNLRDSLNLEQ